MRSRLLQQLDQYEEDRLAMNFKEQFSLYREMLKKKRSKTNFNPKEDLALEVVAARDKEILSVSHLYGFNRKFKAMNHNVVNDKVVKETIFKLKDRSRAQFCSNTSEGYIIQKGSKTKVPLSGATSFHAGDLLVVDVNGYQYIASFIERVEISEDGKAFHIDTDAFKPLVYSVVLHVMFCLIFIAGSWLLPSPDKLTKKKLDRFVSVNIEKLKTRKKEEPKKKVEKKKVEKPVKKIVKKPEKKKVKKVEKKKIEKPVKKIVKKPIKKVKKMVHKPVKGTPSKNVRKLVSKHKPKGKVRTSRTPGYTNNKAQASVKKPTPSVASSSLFKGLGGIGPSKNKKGGGGGSARLLASVTNIKGVKSSKPGAYNISGAIGKIGGKDIQIVRGGAVPTGALGGGGGVAGRSRATGYVANLGKRASEGSIGGVVVDFPEEEGKILEGEGSLSRAEIFKVIERNARAFRYCYEKQLLKNPSISGRVVLNWTIDMRGSVKSAKWKSSEIKSAEVNSCLITRLKDLRFPKPRGNPVTVDFPFVFSSASF